MPGGAVVLGPDEAGMFKVRSAAGRIKVVVERNNNGAVPKQRATAWRNQQAGLGVPLDLGIQIVHVPGCSIIC